MVDVTTAQSQLANDRTLLPPLRQRLSVARDALAGLCRQGAVGLVAARFRSDRADAAQSRAAVACRRRWCASGPTSSPPRPSFMSPAPVIGVATANLYPNFTLSANVLQSAPISAISSPAISPPTASVANMAAPIFHGGTLEAQQRAADRGLRRGLGHLSADRDHGVRPGRRLAAGAAARRRGRQGAGRRGRRRREGAEARPAQLPGGQLDPAAGARRRAASAIAPISGSSRPVTPRARHRRSFWSRSAAAGGTRRRPHRRRPIPPNPAEARAADRPSRRAGAR